MKQPEFISVRAAARSLGIGLKRVYELLYDERLRGAEKRGGRWRIPLSAVQARLKVKGGDNATARG
jgi:excisionase family DNA binding protein